MEPIVQFILRGKLMIRFIMALGMLIALSGASVLSQAAAQQPPTDTLAQAQAQARARSLISEVNTVGCIRLWRPQPLDPKQMPPDRQPGIAGIYLLTPIAANPSGASLPTYVLTPSATLNFWQHLDKKVEIIGNAQGAVLPLTAQEIISGPPARPENRLSVQSMPRLTVTSMKLVTDSCP
jgi:hypothetical protein